MKWRRLSKALVQHVCVKTLMNADYQGEVLGQCFLLLCFAATFYVRILCSAIRWLRIMLIVNNTNKVIALVHRKFSGMHGEWRWWYKMM